MNTQNVQHMVMDTIRGLFTDPQNAYEYANDPKAYLVEKMGDADMSGVDMPAAVKEAAVEAKLSPEATEAMNSAIYQPAPTIRVPVPREYQDAERFDGGKGIEADRADDYLDVDGKGPQVDRGQQEFDRRNDPSDMDNGRPPVTEAPRDLPPVKETVPQGIEPMDDGGFRAQPPETYAPENYHPENYTPKDEPDIDCVEYSVSNCVTTMYQDTPEIADKLCETRDYTDRFVREDPSHSCPEVEIVQHPETVNLYPERTDWERVDEPNDKMGHEDNDPHNRMNERDDRMDERDDRMDERDEQMNERDDRMNERDDRMNERDDRMNERDERMDERDEQMNERDDHRNDEDQRWNEDPNGMDNGQMQDNGMNAGGMDNGGMDNGAELRTDDHSGDMQQISGQRHDNEMNDGGMDDGHRPPPAEAEEWGHGQPTHVADTGEGDNWGNGHDAPMAEPDPMPMMAEEAPMEQVDTYVAPDHDPIEEVVHEPVVHVEAEPMPMEDTMPMEDEMMTE